MFLHRIGIRYSPRCKFCLEEKNTVHTFLKWHDTLFLGLRLIHSWETWGSILVRYVARRGSLAWKLLKETVTLLILFCSVQRKQYTELLKLYAPNINQSKQYLLDQWHSGELSIGFEEDQVYHKEMVLIIDLVIVCFTLVFFIECYIPKLMYAQYTLFLLHIQYCIGPALMAMWYTTLRLTASCLSRLPWFEFQPWACAKIAIDSRLGGGFHLVPRFPSSQNLANWGRKGDKKQNSTFVCKMLPVGNEKQQQKNFQLS